MSSQTNNIILPDTSLCAIIRDEIMNPAGGIVDFVESTVPFVEEAVIVDTGSKDGTREILEELAAKYPQLRVFDRPFDDYSSSRNYSLAHAKTKRALILDADERLKMKDFIGLRNIMLTRSHKGYSFLFYNVLTNPDSDSYGEGHNPRLFTLGRGIHYENERHGYGEYLYEGGHRMDSPRNNQVNTDISIKHFHYDFRGHAKKYDHWYKDIVMERKAAEFGPSDIPESRFWKADNLRREEFR